MPANLGTVNSTTSIALASDIGGSVATDAIWDAAGDLVQGTGADTAAKLGAGTAGQFLKSGGAATANSWASRELDYVQNTSGVSTTATTEAGANTCITATATAFDGSTIVLIEFYTDTIRPRADASAGNIQIWLFDDTGGGAASIGRLAIANKSDATANPMGAPCHAVRRLTPSAATHTYSVRASVSGGTGLVDANTGGTGVAFPMFIRITRTI